MRVITPSVTTGELHEQGKTFISSMSRTPFPRPGNILPQVWERLAIVVDDARDEVQLVNTATGTLWASCEARWLEDIRFNVAEYLLQEISD